jgi:hypothetical protein
MLQDEVDAQEEGASLDGGAARKEAVSLDKTRSRDKIFEMVEALGLPEPVVLFSATFVQTLFFSQASVFVPAFGAALTCASESVFDLALTLLLVGFVLFFAGALFFFCAPPFEAGLVFAFTSFFRGVRDFSLTTAAVSARKGLLV